MNMLSMTSPSSSDVSGLSTIVSPLLRLQFHPHLASAVQGHRLLAVVEVAVLHGRHVGARGLRPLAHAVRVLARVLLDGLGRAAVRVAFAQHRIHRAAQNLAVALLDRLLLVGLRVRRIVRNRVALLLQFLDGGRELGHRSADVGQLDDVGLGQLSQPPSSARLSGTRCSSVSSSENSARMRAATEMSLVSTLIPAGSVKVRMIGRKRVGRQQRRLVGQRVDDGRLLGAHVVFSRRQCRLSVSRRLRTYACPNMGTFAPCATGPAPAESLHDQPSGSHDAACDTLLLGHERQRQAPACWPATLQPRWGAPGDDQVE